MEGRGGRQPFSRSGKKGSQPLRRLFLKQAPKPDAIRGLRAAIVGREQVEAVGRQAYIVYSDGIGRSLLTPGIVDAARPAGTGRNWNTVLEAGRPCGRLSRATGSACPRAATPAFFSAKDSAVAVVFIIKTKLIWIFPSNYP